jgi:AraC-like DNA-binding protein
MATRANTSPWVRTGEPLLWFAGSGREVRTDTSYFFDAARRSDRPHVCLQLTLAGNGFYENRRGRFLLPPGTAWFDVIPGPFHYGYPPEARESYELVHVSFTGPLATRWHRRIVETFGNVLNFGPGNAVAPLMLAIARANAAGALRDRYLASAQLYQVLMTVFSALSQNRLATAPRLVRAIALIEEQAGDASFNVRNMAEQLGCSREHLARLFRAGLGVGPLDYVTQHRLRLAARELRHSDDKLERIARRCGFSGANYLCRAFRKHTQVSPAEFRARTWMTLP